MGVLLQRPLCFFVYFILFFLNVMLFFFYLAALVVHTQTFARVQVQKGAVNDKSLDNQ